MSIAGNNAHSVDKAGNILLDSEDEPNIFHSHLWRRGIIDMPYINNVPLKGPPICDLFDMRDGKIPWACTDDMIRI